MKYINLSIILVFLIFTTCVNINAKSLSLARADTYIIWPMGGFQPSYAQITNQSAVDVSIKAHIYRVDVPADFGVSNCFSAICKPPQYTDFTTDSTLLIPAGQTSRWIDFDIALYIQDTNEYKDATVKVVFYVAGGAVDDTVSYTCVFHVIPFDQWQSVGDDKNLISEIKSYPNPANTNITIDLSNISYDKESQISIYNESGIKINELKINNDYLIINTENLSSGKYFYLISKFGQLPIINTFIVQH